MVSPSICYAWIGFRFRKILLPTSSAHVLDMIYKKKSPFFLPETPDDLLKCFVIQVINHLRSLEKIWKKKISKL